MFIQFSMRVFDELLSINVQSSLSYKRKPVLKGQNLICHFYCKLSCIKHAATFSRQVWPFRWVLKTGLTVYASLSFGSESVCDTGSSFEVIKKVFKLNSAEFKILNAHKYKNIKKHGIFHTQISLVCYFSCS